MPLYTEHFQPSVLNDFKAAVAFGLVPFYSRVTALGNNPDVDTTTTPEDIWSEGGLYPWITAAAALEIISDSTSDAAAGTGARTILINGLDSNYNIVTETKTLNGTIAVAVTTQFFRINSMVILTSGSGGVNAGKIVLRSVSGTVTRACISPGVGITRQSIYTVPAGYTLSVHSIYVGINAISGTDFRNTDICTFFKNADGTYRMPLVLTCTTNNGYLHRSDTGIPLAEKTDFALRCTACSNNNTSITAAWEAILRKNV